MSSRRQSQRLPWLGCLLAVAAVFLTGAYIHPFGAFAMLPVALGLGVFFFFRNGKPSTKPATWPHLIAGNLLLFALFCSVLFLAGETYYRFLCDQTDAMTNTLVSQRWYARHWQKNNFDVRDNVDYIYPLTPGRRRITFVGDSCTAAFGVKNVEDRFANKIRALHPEWDVHCVAIPGLDTSTELNEMHILTVSNGYKIDQLVLVYNLNDVGELMTGYVEGYKKMMANPFRTSWLCQNSFFINLYYHHWQLSHSQYMQHYFDEVEAAYRGPLWEREKRTLNGFQNMANWRNGRLLVVTFPFLDAMPRFRFANDQLNHYWQEHGVPHLDLLDVFSNIPPARLVVNSHDAHPNEYAHALAAAAIDEFLKREAGKTHSITQTN